MIALPDPMPVDPRERHTLACLVDASGLLIAEGAARARAVRLRLTAELPGGTDPSAILRARAPLELSQRDGEVDLPHAWLSRAADVLTLRSDGADAPRDQHGRPLSASNGLVSAGAERWPVVSLLARALRDATLAAAGSRPCFTLDPWPEGKRWAAALSHDLDVASLWPVFTGLRLAELVSKGEVGRTLNVLGSAAAALFADPVRDGVDTVLNAEAAALARSTWFILCGTPSLASFRRGDVTYVAESKRVRDIIARLQREGHEVALHGSFATVEDGSEFPRQRSRLEAITGTPVRGVRQHFLRRVVGETERKMRDAHFSYDSTSGFADRNGFRTGLADVSPVWDEASGTALALEEAPFCWMDRALSKYQGVEEPDRWIDDALELASRCDAVQGLWCGIWHPNLTPALGFPGASVAYARLVQELSSRGAWLAPLDAVVRWRVARRSLRATALDGDGAPVVAAAQDAPRDALSNAGASLRVLDRTGAVRATVRSV